MRHFKRKNERLPVLRVTLALGRSSEGDAETLRRRLGPADMGEDVACGDQASEPTQATLEGGLTLIAPATLTNG